MTTREQALAEAAKEYATKERNSGRSETVSLSKLEVRAFSAGATWEAQRPAVLLEALEKVQGILEENGTPTNAEEMEVLCAALSSYRAKRGE